ncbi:PaaI family thioesterase [Sphingosinicella microcystinivorans]|uniref:PaaI family thioesterase n=1 Tax=Sphingosinicella microcystinivorans TaxID=335406 RepID=UPI0022F3EF25|nr:PaaI family thioesterase [Sphingosinicella microcystinivorans]WBX85071.1 PaaI family thioesterase [Sphingosinicella microcystinivorans]
MNPIVKPIVDAFLGFVPHVKALGLGFRAIGDDWAELTLPYAEHLVAYPGDDGAPGIIASGAIFSLMDSVGGMAVIAKSKRMVRQATLDLRIDYLRPAEPGKTVIGRAEVTRLTRAVAFVKGIAHDGDAADPVALMTACYMFTAGAKS